jgi:triosephosphate isomerase
MASARKPLMAGNWKMNLNHLEAIALVQKLAFSITDRDFEAVEVAVLPPYTDLRSVQTLVDGDKLRLVYGAQDLSRHDSGAYTGRGLRRHARAARVHLRRRRALRAPAVPRGG